MSRKGPKFSGDLIAWYVPAKPVQTDLKLHMKLLYMKLLGRPRKIQQDLATAQAKLETANTAERREVFDALLPKAGSKCMKYEAFALICINMHCLIIHNHSDSYYNSSRFRRVNLFIDIPKLSPQWGHQEDKTLHLTSEMNCDEMDHFLSDLARVPKLPKCGCAVLATFVTFQMEMLAGDSSGSAVAGLSAPVTSKIDEQQRQVFS